jgi:hypothetical protein
MQLARRTRTPLLESLERRTMFVSVQIDYTFDTNNFFDTPEKRTLLQTAADTAVLRFADQLAAIEPSGTNTWKAIIDHPATSSNTEIPNLIVPANTLIVYAGGREMSSLGIGGPGGFTSSGTTAWNDLVGSRGEINSRGDDATDFGPFGGSITFDLTPSGGWYFSLDEAGLASQSDFYSVALHEMTHLLGFGTSDSFEANVVGSTFTGPASLGEFDGTGNIPLSSDRAHWSSGTTDSGKEAAMDPDLTTGTRKTLSALDIAGLDDVGWEIPLTATLASATSITTPGATSTSFTVTYTHYTDIDISTLGTGDLTVTGPNGFNTPASFMSSTGPGKTITATYSITAPGGTFDGSDSGNYSVSVATSTVGDGFGNFVPAGSLGTFAVDINAAPAAMLSAQNVTQLGAVDHTLTVAYTDASGVDVSTLDIADLSVARAGGAPLTITNVSLSASTNGSPRTAAYTLAAPDGAWDATDNGTFTVSLVGQQVKDINGTAADGGILGTFEVAVGAQAFSAGTNVTYTDATGDVVTIALKGPGTGQVVFDDPNDADASGIVLTGTTAASTLTLTAAGAGTTLGGLAVNGALKSVTGKAVDLAGAMTVSATVPKIQFRNATGSITIDGAGVANTITLASVYNLSITSASAIKALKTGEWLDPNGARDVITTPTLTSLTVKGVNFEADIAADTIGRINVSGQLGRADIRATVSIGSVTAASAAESFIYAGVQPGLTTLPDSLDDFANPAASIKSITLKGKNAVFSKTRIAAPFVSKAVLGSATLGTDATNPFGIAADTINSVSGSTSTQGPFRFTRLTDPASSFAVVDFAIVVL